MLSGEMLLLLDEQGRNAHIWLWLEWPWGHIVTLSELFSLGHQAVGLSLMSG